MFAVFVLILQVDLAEFVLAILVFIIYLLKWADRVHAVSETVTGGFLFNESQISAASRTLSLKFKSLDP